jgi:hypothetical protein
VGLLAPSILINVELALIINPFNILKHVELSTPLLEAFQGASRFGVEHRGWAQAVTAHRSTILVDGELVSGRAFLCH